MRRILKAGDVRPLIIDFNDVLSVYKNQTKIREKNYNASKYKIENYYLHNNKILKPADFTKITGEQTNDSIINNYDTTWKSVLDMTRVETEDAQAGIENEIIENTNIPYMFD